MHHKSVASLIAVTAGLWIAGSAVAQTTSPATPATQPAATQPAAPAATQPSAQQPNQPSPQPAADDTAQAAFKAADANKDGQLSREESAKLPVIASRFAELDKNKDGQLSWDEFKAGYRAAPEVTHPALQRPAAPLGCDAQPFRTVGAGAPAVRDANAVAAAAARPTPPLEAAVPVPPGSARPTHPRHSCACCAASLSLRQ